jgi:aryl-alcohol dehydrogenase-like predicted oxidoreductase
VLDACQDIGAAFVAFSPLARGYLSGRLRDVSAFDARDIRRGMPRFEPAHYAANLRLLDGYAAIASELGCAPAQLALAWLLTRGEHLIALPGTTNLAHLEEDLGAGELVLDAATLARLDALINRHTVSGARYNAATQAEIDTEEFGAAGA